MSEAKTLHLTLKKKWFDMILRGEKKEEYREIKPYWITRLIDINHPEEYRHERKHAPYDIMYDLQTLYHFTPQEILEAYYSKYKIFNTISFTNGYAKNAPTMTVECRGIKIGRTKGEWADNAEQKVFVIKLGNILFHKNCN